MALKKETITKIHDFIKYKITEKIENYSLESKDSSKPFQYALFTKKNYLVKGFIHGCETALGNWHESVARIVAEENFLIAKKLQRTEKFKGKISSQAQNKIDDILNDLENVTREPNSETESEEIFEASQSQQGLDRTQTVDLYLKRKNGEEIYFEIKGPKPNKNEMKAAKKDLLEISAMAAFKGEKVKIYLGMYYNPYYPKDYTRWTTIKYFQKEGDFLVGESFWNFLGGEGSYKQIIEIYEKVGIEIRPILEKKLKSFN